MKLTCKECDESILSEDINISSLVAKCRNCHSVFSFSTEVSSVDTLNKDDKPFSNYGFNKSQEQVIPLPKGIKFEPSADGIQAEYKWFRLEIVFLTFFALFWNSITLGFVGATFLSGFYFMAAFGLIHVGVGFFLAYKVLTGYINKTVIAVNRQTLRIQHKPLPWPGNREIPSHKLEQLYSKSVVSGGRSRTVTYEVHAILLDKSHIPLVKNLQSSEQALYIEKTIEDYLRIRNRVVRGEIGASGSYV